VIQTRGAFYPIKGIADHEEHKPFLILEFAPNGSLDQYMYGKSSPQVSVKQLLDVLLGVVDGLLYIHGQGIAHRDLKPHNILLDGDFVPKLADFGLARTRGSMSLMQSKVGTSNYMAPEVHGDEWYTISCDVWSLGVILFEVISGTQLFGGRGDGFIFRALLIDKQLPLKDLKNSCASKWPADL